MNYHFYIVIFLSFIGIFFVPLWFGYTLKLDFFTKRSLKKIANNNPLFLSGYIIHSVIKTALRQHQKHIIDCLLEGKTDKAARLIQKENAFNALLLKSFYHPVAAAKKIRTLYKKNPQNNDYAAWLAVLSEANKDYATADNVWDNVKEKKLPPYLFAHYKAHLARIALKNGDMEFSSRLFYQAAKLFNKEKYFYEEANIYLQLGTIYRICFVDDVAETLFHSALKIFKTLKYKEGIAKAYANLGVLMVGQERFDEADGYFTGALNLYNSFEQPLAVAEIKNQQALLLLLKKDYVSAQKLLTKTIKEHSVLNNFNGIAFGFELSANCFWKQKNFDKTLSYAKKATSFYLKTDNASGLLESLYLQAQALFNLNKDKSAESILRKIISFAQKDCGCFYLANAYNLLGIIYMRRQDLLRAKGLFQQSLDLEQRGFRTNALAADYANIGLVELSRGSKETALKNLKTALNLAQQAEDAELCAQIQCQLERFSN
ncbi:MAG: tetratricopeptide repeat protein [Alphaproteobacteria bacterium]|nr:tetratricopeptide repeat protein [Alphaproteobacteria bacterium]